jgi:hypothetical protein
MIADIPTPVIVLASAYHGGRSLGRCDLRTGFAVLLELAGGARSPLGLTFQAAGDQLSLMFVTVIW